MARARKPKTPFAKRLQEAMAEGNLSQRAVARAVSDRLGREIQGGYISRIESGGRGHRLEPELLFAIADAVGVEPRWLWLGDGAKRNALSAAYTEMVTNLRAQILAIRETTGKTPGPGSKLGKLLEQAERARIDAVGNDLARERERLATQPVEKAG